MSNRQRVKWAVIAGAAVVVIVMLLGRTSLPATITWQKLTGLREATTWQKLTSPGRLSKAHAFLENNCAACHTAVKGPDPSKCIACHAGDKALLQRQPTAFHAYINSCRECHFEHLGVSRQPIAMDHASLTEISLRQLESPDMSSHGGKQFRAQVNAWIDRNASIPPVSGISSYEAVLNCSACHANQDPHFKLFGQNSSLCHSTTRWTIDHFRHPSPRSTECAHCHQAPPSHYMMHFHMISAKVAGKPWAKVNQCYLCHHTNSWNDIKGVGWYMHH